MNFRTRFYSFTEIVIDIIYTFIYLFNIEFKI